MEQSPEDLHKKQKNKTDSGDVPKKRVNGMVKDQFKNPDLEVKPTNRP